MNNEIAKHGLINSLPNSENKYMAWLVKNGIDKSRLTAKGFGESRLLNKYADGVKCTKAEHQVNRRSEFIIVK